MEWVSTALTILSSVVAVAVSYGVQKTKIVLLQDICTELKQENKILAAELRALHDKFVTQSEFKAVTLKISEDIRTILNYFISHDRK